MKTKKIFYTFGIVMVGMTVASTTISCSQKKGRYIDLSQTNIDLWIAKNKGYYTFIQNNDLQGGGSIDMPIYNSNVESQLGKIFGSYKREIKPIQFLTPSTMNVIDLKKEFLRVNKKIIEIKEEFVKTNPNKQLIAFYGLTVGVGISVYLKDISITATPDEFKFFDSIPETSDFKSVDSMKNTNQQPKTPNNEGQMNNGFALRVPWATKLKSNVLTNAINTKAIGAKTIESLKEDSWQLFIGNRMGKDASYWEEKWEKHPVNLMGYPYIDYKNHVLKLMTIGFEGGKVYDKKDGLGISMDFKDAKHIKYKVTTISGVLPVSDIAKTIIPEEKLLLKQVIMDLIKWMNEAGGPQVMDMSLKLVSGILPQAQVLIENIQILTHEWNNQKVNWKNAHQTDMPDPEEDYKKLKMFQKSEIDKVMDQIIGNLEANNYDFSVLQDMQKIMRGINNNYEFKSLGGISVPWLDGNDYKTYIISWIIDMNKENQFILFQTLYLLKYISKIIGSIHGDSIIL